MTEFSPETCQLMKELEGLGLRTMWPEAVERSLENALLGAYHKGCRLGEQHAMEKSTYHRNKSMEEM